MKRSWYWGWAGWRFWRKEINDVVCGKIVVWQIGPYRSLRIKEDKDGN